MGRVSETNEAFEVINLFLLTFSPFFSKFILRSYSDRCQPPREQEASGRAVIKKAADFNGRVRFAALLIFKLFFASSLTHVDGAATQDLANTAWGFAVMFSLRGAQSQDRKIKPRRKDCPLTAALHALAEAASDKVRAIPAAFFFF